MEQDPWSDWQAFPDPENGDFLHAPFGPGVYELRRSDTHELILVGMSKNCAYRVTSLLSKPLGAGTRNNSAKIQYVTNHRGKVQYRCLACVTSADARKIETIMRRSNEYMYST